MELLGSPSVKANRDVILTPSLGRMSDVRVWEHSAVVQSSIFRGDSAHRRQSGIVHACEVQSQPAPTRLRRCTTLTSDKDLVAEVMHLVQASRCCTIQAH